MSQLIKLTSHSFLREHPFQNPISQPNVPGLGSPNDQDHSYIFPGDELFMWHKIVLPSDHPTAGGMNDISFQSAKVSIIAKRPGVFSEEFSPQFLSTRIFVLDSWSTVLNNSTAPVIPWTSDGNAPFLNVNVDRNWKLPPADLRRQVKFFTTHTPSSNQWQFYFYFPVIFRWEYWLPMLNVHNDFFDVSQPQNGQNQWWYHYYKTVPNLWQIFSRLELSTVVSGVPTIFRCEQLLTPSGIGGDVNDYNSNADWTAKSIKTSPIGGVFSNSPCLIKSNQPTAVNGYFTKVSAWTTSEQTKIGAQISIEPFEGAGRDARTRASSYYPVGAESVFMGLNLSLTDDSGIGIIDSATGQYIVTDLTGNGVITYFDALNPLDVMFFALIDDQKLAAVYPGVSKFTLYVRLYNTEVTADKTRRGECIKQDAFLVTIPIVNDLCVKRSPECPFNLEVFAEKTATDPLKNDTNSFYEYGDALTSNIVFTLQKNVSNCGTGDWVDKATISGPTYGSFFSYGASNDFLGGTFTDDYDKKYTGLKLSWSSVLNAFDEGNYRMKIVKTDAFGNITTYYDQRTFCLKEWNCNLINETVIIEFVNEGIRGSLSNPNQFIDYAGGWYDRIRLRGLLKQTGSTYNEERNQYGDSSYNAIRPIVSEQKPKYTLSVRPIPGWLDWFMSTNILQADSILITDCNDRNRHVLTRVPVMNDGEFTPTDNNLANPLAMVNVRLVYGQNNLRKRNSR